MTESLQPLEEVTYRFQWQPSTRSRYWAVCAWYWARREPARLFDEYTTSCEMNRAVLKAVVHWFFFEKLPPIYLLTRAMVVGVFGAIGLGVYLGIVGLVQTIAQVNNLVRTAAPAVLVAILIYLLVKAVKKYPSVQDISVICLFRFLLQFASRQFCVKILHP